MVQHFINYKFSSKFGENWTHFISFLLTKLCGINFVESFCIVIRIRMKIILYLKNDQKVLWASAGASFYIILYSFMRWIIKNIFWRDLSEFTKALQFNGNTIYVKNLSSGDCMKKLAKYLKIILSRESIILLNLIW